MGCKSSPERTFAVVTSGTATNDHDATGLNATIKLRVQHEPPQKHSHNRLHVRISRHLRRRYMLEEPDVGGVTDPRSEDNEIQYSRDTAPMENGAMILTAEQKQYAAPKSGEDHLPTGSDERINFHRRDESGKLIEQINCMSPRLSR